MSEQQTSKIGIRDLGMSPYGEALVIQELTHKSVVEGEDPQILTVEHPPVLTLGKNADSRYLLFSKEFYAAQGVELFETERGGEVTAHMPGQLVIYPILPIVRMGLSARAYVNCLEQAVIDLLAGFGIAAHRDFEYPGVWIGHEKICALGVRIKSRVSMHGLALNVNNSLDLFGQIVPCGIKFRGVTTIAKYLGRDVNVCDVRSALVANIIGSVAAQLSALRNKAI